MGFYCIDCDTANNSDFDNENMKCKRCGSNNIADIAGTMTFEDIWALTNISKDKNFLMAMSRLHETDIIDYNLKMSQFKSQMEQQKESDKKRSNQVSCPYCNSTNVKKIGGAERLVSVGTLGLFSKKINKNFKCGNCGGTF